MSKVGDRIRVLRIKRGLSQSRLADAVGLKRSAIGNYERGIRVPDLDTIEAFADYFDVSIADITGREETEAVLEADMPSPDEWKLLHGLRSMPSNEAKVIMNMILSGINDHKNGKE